METLQADQKARETFETSNDNDGSIRYNRASTVSLLYSYGRLYPHLDDTNTAYTTSMPSLPPALDFPGMEEDICAKWKEQDTFKTQDRLSLERGDEVRYVIRYTVYSVRMRMLALVLMCML